ncbi:MAG: hypothetical protein KAT17_05770, partial [Candidatus Aminicenantes bacterium]|nr:hypothetical protein [Candidatus Aminicenantes bacterium]
EIAQTYDHLKEIDYERLERAGIKIEKPDIPHQIDLSLPEVFRRINYQVILCMKCKGMKDITAKMFKERE